MGTPRCQARRACRTIAAMVAKPQPRTATYADVLAAPEHMIAEIMGGELVLHPRPTIPHQVAASEIGADLIVTVGRRGPPDGWVILVEPELHVGPSGDVDILGPDLAGWRRSRLPTPPQTAFITLAPDWVCEVLSPATELRDRTDKLAIYARERVAFLWLVAVRTRHVEVYRQEGGLWTLIATAQGDGEARLAPFEDVPIVLGRLWPDVPGDVSDAP